MGRGERSFWGMRTIAGCLPEGSRSFPARHSFPFGSRTASEAEPKNLNTDEILQPFGLQNDGGGNGLQNEKSGSFEVLFDPASKQRGVLADFVKTRMETAKSRFIRGVVWSLVLCFVGIFLFSPQATAGLYDDASGNIGIGTTAPTSKLTVGVVGASTPAAINIVGLSYIGAATANSGTVYLGAGDTYGELQAWKYGASAGAIPLALQAGGGYVGIGTTSPSQKLHVEGQCVTGDTVLSIFEKSVQGSRFEVRGVQIKDVQPGMMVCSLNETTGEVEPHLIEALIDMGVKPVFKLITEKGKEIRTTGNHPYLAAQMEGVNREEVALRRIEEITTKQSHLDRQSLAEERNVSDGKLLWQLSSYIQDNQREINYQNDNSDNKKKNVVHTNLPLARYYPYKDNESYYSGDKIKSQKRHNFLAPIFDSITAIIRNNTVIAMPIENVSNGALTTTPGTNMPTTNEANRIFAPSRKNSESVSKLSLSNIQDKSTTETTFCQEAWAKVIHLVSGDLIAVLPQNLELGTWNLENSQAPSSQVLWDKIKSIEYIGEEQVYDIAVEGTQNFFGNGILAHNTYLNGNVGIGETAPIAKLDVAGSATNGQSLRLRSGDYITETDSNQILLSYDNTNEFTHAIKSRHNAGGVENAIDFYVWNYLGQSEVEIGNKHVMTLQNGSVGIGTTTPSNKLSVNGFVDTGNEGIKWDVVTITLDGASPDTVAYTVDESKVVSISAASHDSATYVLQGGHRVDTYSCYTEINNDVLRVWYGASYSAGDILHVLIVTIE